MRKYSDALHWWSVWAFVPIWILCGIIFVLHDTKIMLALIGIQIFILITQILAGVLHNKYR